MAVYMAWQDETKGKTLDMRIAEALAYYRFHHGEPSIIVIPKDAKPEKAYGVPVRDDSMVRVNHVYIGHD